jgi:hypothetical protein
MKTLFLLCLILVGCTEAASVSSRRLALEGCMSDGGVDDPVWATGVRLYGERLDEGLPTLLAGWEDPQANVLKIGSGQGAATQGYRSLETLQLDADGKIAFLINGRPLIKIQDHQVGYLLHLTEMPRLWFGNVNRQDVELLYQGTSGGGDLAGYEMLIRGQSAAGNASATSVTGGDLVVRAGDASAAGTATTDPGELILSGGRVGNAPRGNIALHGEPPDWCGLEGGVYVRDAVTAPSADPTGGGFLFASAGALYWRGSAGTVTQVAVP